MHVDGAVPGWSERHPCGPGAASVLTAAGEAATAEMMAASAAAESIAHAEIRKHQRVVSEWLQELKRGDEDDARRLACVREAENS